MAGLLRKILKKDKPDKDKKAAGKPAGFSVEKGKEKKPINRSGQAPEIRLPTQSQKDDISAYLSVQSAHITEKAGILSEQNKYVFRVYPRANKPEIKKSVESLYGVRVGKVHIIHSAPKKMRLGRREGFKRGLKKGFKKAIVTLEEGSKIDLSPR